MDRNLASLLDLYADKRLQTSYDVCATASNVFNPKEVAAFLEVLLELDRISTEIKFGGRRLRELIGFTTYDLAEYIVSDADALERDVLNGFSHDGLRIWELIQFMKNYPTERMLLEDFDLFAWGITEPQNIISLFGTKGFEVKLHTATGNVWVIEITGEKGSATIIDGAKSWQTDQEYWPMLGVLSKFNPEKKTFDVDASMMRFYVYPLMFPISLPKLDPVHPRRFAAVSRALLWAVTVKDPKGQVLEPPPRHTWDVYGDTISALPKLIKYLKENPDQVINYRGGLRDISIALKLIVMYDFYNIQTGSQGKFLEYIRSIWVCAAGSRFIQRES